MGRNWEQDRSPCWGALSSYPLLQYDMICRLENRNVAYVKFEEPLSYNSSQNQPIMIPASSRFPYQPLSVVMFHLYLIYVYICMCFLSHSNAGCFWMPLESFGHVILQWILKTCLYQCSNTWMIADYRMLRYHTRNLCYHTFCSLLATAVKSISLFISQIVSL